LKPFRIPRFSCGVSPPDCGLVNSASLKILCHVVSVAG